MAPHSSTLAWRIPWREEPGRLQSMGLQSRTQLRDFTFSFLSNGWDLRVCVCLRESVLCSEGPGI